VLGSYNEKQKASEDHLAEMLTTLNKSGQQLGPLATKHKAAVANPHNYASLALPSAPRPWTVAMDGTSAKSKPLGEGPIRNLMDSSKHELKEKMREGMEQFRVGSSFGEAENALMTKIRKKTIKNEFEVNLNMPPAQMIKGDGAKDLSYNLPQISKKKLSLMGEIHGEEARRDIAIVPRLKQDRPPPTT
jgi:hypothetical protein